VLSVGGSTMHHRGPWLAEESSMVRSGHVVFGRMEGVRFGAPAAEAVALEAGRLAAERVFLMVSGTLARTTDEIDKVRRALGHSCAGVFDRMPQHTPRPAVIEAAAAAVR
jgi:maleylacetate reductase